MKIPLSNRLLACANFIQPGDRVAEIGCDHGYLGIYLLKENFSQIPDELYYAAKVDGTSDFKYLTQVLIPICKPTIITITTIINLHTDKVFLSVFFHISVPFVILHINLAQKTMFLFI